MRASSRPASAPSRRGKGALYSAQAQRKEGNSFAGQEITILRNAQLTSIGDGVGRTRTQPPSYMSSSDWSKGAEAAIPHDYTLIPDRAFGTNKDDRTILTLAEKLGVVVHEHEHSAGMLGLERSKAAFAAVRQRFDECENEKNIKWFEGHSFHASGLYGSKDQPIEYSPSGKVKNRKLKYSDVLREFENRVQRGRSISSTHSGNLSVDFLSDHIDDLLNLTKASEDGKGRWKSPGASSAAGSIRAEQSREISTQTPTAKRGSKSQTLMLVRPGSRDSWLMDGGRTITSPWK